MVSRDAAPAPPGTDDRRTEQIMTMPGLTITAVLLPPGCGRPRTKHSAAGLPSRTDGQGAADAPNRLVRVRSGPPWQPLRAAPVIAAVACQDIRVADM